MWLSLSQVCMKLANFVWLLCKKVHSSHKFSCILTICHTRPFAVKAISAHIQFNSAGKLNSSPLLPLKGRNWWNFNYSLQFLPRHRTWRRRKSNLVKHLATGNGFLESSSRWDEITSLAPRLERTESFQKRTSSVISFGFLLSLFFDGVCVKRSKKWTLARLVSSFTTDDKSENVVRQTINAVSYFSFLLHWVFYDLSP